MPKNNVHKPRVKNLPMIKCECGAEILIVPDVEVMSNAIENHVKEHMQKEKDPVQAEVVADRIRDDLIVQVLKKASASTK